MATDATGAPTPLGIPKYNTSADAPSGLGFNATMDVLDTLIAARVAKPAGIVTSEVPVWDSVAGAFVRSSTTKIGTGSLAGYPWSNADIAAAAGIAYSKMNNPGGTTTFLRADGTFAAPVYDRATTTVDVQNTLVETSLYTKTITGNDLGTNRSLRLRIVGDWLHNNVAGDAVTLKIKFGGTTFWSSVSALGAAIGAARHPWSMDVLVSNLAATNSQMISGFLAPGEASNVAAPANGIGNWGAAPSLGMAFGIATLGTIDTTANQTLDITAQWSAASVNNSWRMRYALLELV